MSEALGAAAFDSKVPIQALIALVVTDPLESTDDPVNPVPEFGRQLVVPVGGV